MQGITNAPEGKICLLINDYCNEEQKIVIDAWQRLQCYIDYYNYDWTFDRIKYDYQKYYLNGSYCSHTLMDIIKNNESDCKMLFGLGR